MPNTITEYSVFVPKTVIESGQVNTNFSNHRGTLLPISEDTSTALNNTYQLGTSEYIWSDSFLNKATLAEISTPSTPASGFGRIYFKSDGSLYQLNDAGVESKAGGTTLYQTKFLAADKGATAGALTLTDLTFSNLTSGKTYRFMLQGRFQAGGTLGPVFIDITYDDDIVGGLHHGDADTSNVFKSCATGVFTADTSASLTFVATIATSATVYGNGTREETYAQLEELPAHTTTTQW